MIKKKKIAAKLVPYRYMSDPMRRFAYGLLAGIENLRTSKMIKPKPKRFVSAVDCDGCKALILADVNRVVPLRCPKCGRPTSEAIREFWLATERKSPPAAGDHQSGFHPFKSRRAKKK